MAELLAEIEKLSLEERIEILEALWESIDAEAADLTEAEHLRLDARIAAYQQNRADVIAWEQLKADLANG